MEYLKNNEIKNEVIDCLLDKLEDSEELETYGCDLAYQLFESDNMDGVCWFVGASYYENDEIIKKYWDDLPEIIEEIKANFDDDYFKDFLYSMFDNPCKFVLIIFIEVANYLLGQCKFVENNWDNEIILTEKNIKTISKELEALKD